MSTPKERRSGMTIVELLIAATILLIILSVIGASFISSRRAYEANKRVAEGSMQLRAAIEALQYDISLAGYCPDTGGCTFPNGTLHVDPPAGGPEADLKSIRATYFDERYGSGSRATVTYELVDGSLIRQLNGEEPVAVANGVSRLVVAGYRNKKGPTAATLINRPSDENIGGVVLQIRHQDNGGPLTQEFTIPLQNNQEFGAS